MPEQQQPIEVALEITVVRRDVNLEKATVRLDLSCGHSFTSEFAPCPVVRLVEMFGWPEIGEAVRCPYCGGTQTLIIGSLSDEPITVH